MDDETQAIGLVPLEEGTDPGELKRVGGAQQMSFTHAGKRWTVSYEPVTWEQQWDAIEAAWSVGTDAAGKELPPRFDAKRYYRQLLSQAIKRLGSRKGMADSLLRELDPGVFAKLTTIVPSPVLNLAADSVKKE